MDKVQKVLDFHITVKGRLKFYVLVFGLKSTWFLINQIIKKIKHHRMLKIAAAYLKDREVRIS